MDRAERPPERFFIALQYAMSWNDLYSAVLPLDKFLDGIGARLVIVHLGNANFAMTDLWEDYHRLYSHPRFFVREALADWCEESGIVFADAIEALEERYQRSGMQRTSLILPVDNHYNAGGHEVVASVFLAALREAGLDDPPASAR